MEYVLDPNDPLIKKHNIRPKLIAKLDKGLELVEDNSNSLLELNYVAVDIGLDKTLLTKYTIKQRAEIVSSLQEILKVVFNIYYKTPIEFVNVLEMKDAYIFTPYSPFKTLIYENSKYLVEINIEKFVGYSLLSRSPLTRYLIEKWIDQKEYLLSDLNIRYFNTPEGYISLIPLFNPYSNEISGRVENSLLSLVKQGYFAYIFGIHDLENLEIIRELCLLYDIHIIDSKDLSVLICRTDVDFTTTPQEWLTYNLSLIKSGQFPTFRLSFDFSFFNQYIRIYGEQLKDIILKYVAYLSYSRLSDLHPVIKPFIMFTTINDDLSVSVSLPSYSLVLTFKEYVLKYLNDGISHLNNGQMSGAWNIEPVDNFKEGILKRWIVQQVDNDAYPMFFQTQGGKQLLIHRSPLGIKYPSRFNFENLKEAEDSLLREMRKFYLSNKVCHDNLEPVTLENIDQMSLDELLNLIPVEENGKVYCFSDSTISSLVKKENPLTRRPLTEKSLATQKYLEYGLRGLFDVGVLFGLYSEVPIKQNIPINIGVVRTSREYVEPKRRELVGNIFLAEVIFEDGTTTPLFEISLPTIELSRLFSLKEYLNNLWSKGYFLSPFASAVYLYLDLKSFPILINSEVLLHAADSIYDGNIALEMLKNQSNL